MRGEKTEKLIFLTVAAAAALGASWLFAAYLVPVLLPFLAAFAFSCFIKPLVGLLSEKTHVKRGFWSAAVILLAGGALCLLVWFGTSILVREGSAAVRSLSEMLADENNPVSELFDKINVYFGKFNLGVRTDSLPDAVTGMLSGLLGALSTGAAGFAGKVVSAAPSFVFSFAVFIIALFYFCADRGGISKAFSRFLPERAYEALSSVLSLLCKALRRFARAYGTIMLITFSELFVGFVIVGVDYAFLAAILTALVDVLPVLGAGTVLVPWAIILLLTGESAAGIKMLILFAVMSAVRQVIEPKIIGRGAGVHPVTALLAVYAGFRFGGVAGLIIAPVLLNAASVFIEVKNSGAEKKSQPQSE